MSTIWQTSAPKKEMNCVKDQEGTLGDDGWQEWSRFPPTGRHLRVRVWDHASTKPGEKAVIVVAFGGTDFYDKDDWRANLRWIFPGRDEYTDIVDSFQRWFEKELVAQSARPEKAYLHSATCIRPDILSAEAWPNTLLTPIRTIGRRLSP